MKLNLITLVFLALYSISCRTVSNSARLNEDADIYEVKTTVERYRDVKAFDVSVNDYHSLPLGIGGIPHVQLDFEVVAKIDEGWLCGSEYTLREIGSSYIAEDHLLANYEGEVSSNGCERKPNGKMIEMIAPMTITPTAGRLTIYLPGDLSLRMAKTSPHKAEIETARMFSEYQVLKPYGGIVDLKIKTNIEGDLCNTNSIAEIEPERTNQTTIIGALGVLSTEIACGSNETKIDPLEVRRSYAVHPEFEQLSVLVPKNFTVELTGTAPVLDQ